MHLRNFKLIKLLFPKSCLTCEGDVESDAPGHICMACELDLPLNKNIPYVNFEFCGIYSPYLYRGKIRDIILNMKFTGREYLVPWITKMAMAAAWKDEIPEVDCVIPIPSSYLRERLRGFNQSHLISKIVAERLYKPLLSDVLGRRFLTKTQSKLGKRQRFENAGKSYYLKSESSLRGKQSVLLVDDVLTTGATLLSCAQILKNTSIRDIFVFTLAFEEAPAR